MARPVARATAGRDDPWTDVTLIPEAGHFVMEDAPAEVTQALLEFLDPSG